MIRSLASSPDIGPLPCAFRTFVVDLAALADLSGDVISECPGSLQLLIPAFSLFCKHLMEHDARKHGSKEQQHIAVGADQSGERRARAVPGNPSTHAK